MIKQAWYLSSFEVLMPYKTKSTFAGIWDRKNKTGIANFGRCDGDRRKKIKQSSIKIGA